MPYPGLGSYVAAEKRSIQNVVPPGAKSGVMVVSLNIDNGAPSRERTDLSTDISLSADILPYLLDAQGVQPQGDPTQHETTGCYVAMYDSVFEGWSPCNLGKGQVGSEKGYCIPVYECIPDNKPIHGTLCYLPCKEEKLIPEHLRYKLI
ncbi:hypothetical protein N9Z02_02785 [Akkermansiaceae bacterium]|nr:hypothetical protein [Akkermansiaceae bacterium]